MFERLLVAIKEPSEAIPLAVAAAALAGPGAHADVVHAAPAGDRDSAPLQAGVDTLRAQGLRATGHLHPLGGRSLAEDIAGLAGDVGADCILLGSRGLGGLRALVEGSVPDGASLPIGGVHRVLAAVADESEVEPVLAAAAAFGGTVLAVHVPRPVAVHSGPEGTYVEAPETSNDVLRLAAESGRRSGYRLMTLKLDSGEPAAEQIAQAAERFGADLVVVGSHRPGGLEAAFAGSVGHRLLALARLPVLFAAPPPALAKEMQR